LTDNTADGEGVVGVARGKVEEMLAKAQAKAAADAATRLGEWEKKHRAGVEAALRAKGYRA
jgi:hypothetical protein